MTALTLDDWTAADDRAAAREGWSLFENDGSADGTPQVQRIDDPGPGEAELDGDPAAWAVLRGDPGAPLHAKALAIIANENPAEYARVMNQDRRLMDQQDGKPDTGSQAAGPASGTWEAIEPYEPRRGFWRGRAQITDGNTTEAELCTHPGLSESHPGHDDKPAAWACGQALAATLREGHLDLHTPP